MTIVADLAAIADRIEREETTVRWRFWPRPRRETHKFDGLSATIEIMAGASRPLSGEEMLAVVVGRSLSTATMALMENNIRLAQVLHGLSERHSQLLA